MIDMDAPPKTLRQLMATHPQYRGDRLRLLDALYKGGECLFGSDRIMADLFPKHRREEDGVYAERRRRAYYIPYAGEIIDHLVASLFQQPLGSPIETIPPSRNTTRVSLLISVRRVATGVR